MPNKASHGEAAAAKVPAQMLPSYKKIKNIAELPATDYKSILTAIREHTPSSPLRPCRRWRTSLVTMTMVAPDDYFAPVKTHNFVNKSKEMQNLVNK